MVMLTDEELIDIRNRAKLNDNMQINPMLFARDIERAVLAKVMPIPKQEPVVAGEYKAHEWWRVEVKLYDGTLLAIEPEMLAGKSDLTGRDEETIRAAGSHLLAFIGDPQPAQAAAIPDGYTAIKTDVFLWLLGDNGEFKCPENLYFGGNPAPYFWRNNLRESTLSASPKPE